ncbi:TPA: hypothetical protein SL557_000125 [Pseudomonas aeruginosa]|nr:hypothetical protein [Pseudomonas aeruginosa]
MANPASTDLLNRVNAALRKPPRIVSQFLNAGLVAAAHGAGATTAIGGAPAGGSTKGWWSNGVYLMFKDQAIACRSSGSRALLVLESCAAAVAGSGLVIGLEAVPVASLD